jgi:hypothetical protein
MNLLYSSSLGIVSESPSTAIISSLLKSGRSDFVKEIRDKVWSQIGESSSPDSQGCKIVTRPDSSGSHQSKDICENSLILEEYF